MEPGGKTKRSRRKGTAHHPFHSKKVTTKRKTRKEVGGGEKKERRSEPHWSRVRSRKSSLQVREVEKRDENNEKEERCTWGWYRRIKANRGTNERKQKKNAGKPCIFFFV